MSHINEHRHCCHHNTVNVWCSMFRDQKQTQLNYYNLVLDFIMFFLFFCCTPLPAAAGFCAILLDIFLNSFPFLKANFIMPSSRHWNNKNLYVYLPVYVCTYMRSCVSLASTVSLIDTYADIASHLLRRYICMYTWICTYIHI